MTTPKVIGNGTQGVTPQTNTSAKSNPAVTATPTAEQKTKPKTLKEQLAYFEGMEELVERRRNYDGHLTVVKGLTISKAHAQEFELSDTYGLKIELYDSDRRSYKIAHPKLVAEMRDHLIKLIEGKMAEIDAEIIAYTA